MLKTRTKIVESTMAHFAYKEKSNIYYSSPYSSTSKSSSSQILYNSCKISIEAFNVQG
jgi:hypothetical protein